MDELFLFLDIDRICDQRYEDCINAEVGMPNAEVFVNAKVSNYTKLFETDILIPQLAFRLPN